MDEIQRANLTSTSSAINFDSTRQANNNSITVISPNIAPLKFERSHNDLIRIIKASKNPDHKVARKTAIKLYRGPISLAPTLSIGAGERRQALFLKRLDTQKLEDNEFPTHFGKRPDPHDYKGMHPNLTNMAVVFKVESCLDEHIEFVNAGISNGIMYYGPWNLHPITWKWVSLRCPCCGSNVGAKPNKVEFLRGIKAFKMHLKRVHGVKFSDNKSLGQGIKSLSQVFEYCVDEVQDADEPDGSWLFTRRPKIESIWRRIAPEKTDSASHLAKFGAAATESDMTEDDEPEAETQGSTIGPGAIKQGEGNDDEDRYYWTAED